VGVRASKRARIFRAPCTCAHSHTHGDRLGAGRVYPIANAPPLPFSWFFENKCLSPCSCVLVLAPANPRTLAQRSQNSSTSAECRGKKVHDATDNTSYYNCVFPIPENILFDTVLVKHTERIYIFATSKSTTVTLSRRRRRRRQSVTRDRWAHACHRRCFPFIYTYTRTNYLTYGTCWGHRRRCNGFFDVINDQSIDDGTE